ncbi:hypothetical protein HYDPIDRAFT_151410 [Hydnomerulius pinastri MD-312]|nr:hypothetical protein HYDPIDRAFT_151410 [Hydnomerulius pinastri MD-312]
MSGQREVEALLKIIQNSARSAVAEYSKGGQEVPTRRSTDFHPLDCASDNVQLKKAVRLLEGACQQLCASLAPPQRTIMNLTESYDWACIGIVLRAGVPDVLEKYPDGLHVSELSENVHLDRGKLSRILRVLASKGCFVEVERDVFANNRLSKALSSSCDSSCFARLISFDVSRGAAMLGETLANPDHETSSRVEDSPFLCALKKEGFQGTNSFDWVREDEARLENFHRAMIGAGDAMGSLSILNHYPWNNVSTVCDVGAGAGNFSIPLIKTFPHLQVVVQDLPDVLEQGKEVWALAKDTLELVDQGRVKFVPLDFFKECPVEGQDVYYLRYILHDWPDEEAATILRSVRKVMKPCSRLLIHDFVLASGTRATPEDETFGVDTAPEPMLPNFGAGNHTMYHRDLTMWIVQNAKERTVSECLALGQAAGLRLEKVYDLAESTVLEFMLDQARSKY